MKKFTHYLSVLLCTAVVQMVAQSASGQGSAAPFKGRKLLLRDEGLAQLSYVDQTDPKKNWFVAVPAGRDLQLIGEGKVLIGTGTGYEEREIATGKKVKELTTFTGTITARRLRNGNTLLVGLNWQDKKGIVLTELDASGKIQKVINYPEFGYVRLVRPTTSGTFLITSDTTVFEGNEKGEVIWRAKIASEKRPHAWQAIRLNSGETLVSTGYGGNFQLFAKDGSLIKKFNGPDDINPSFYAGFQILENGNYVVANWQGHGPGHGDSGTQVLEYNPKGELVGYWKQDPALYSSVQGVLVLDGLNLKKLHIEDKYGKLAPVK